MKIIETKSSSNCWFCDISFDIKLQYDHSAFHHSVINCKANQYKIKVEKSTKRTQSQEKIFFHSVLSPLLFHKNSSCLFHIFDPSPQFLLKILDCWLRSVSNSRNMCSFHSYLCKLVRKNTWSVLRDSNFAHYHLLNCDLVCRSMK